MNNAKRCQFDWGLTLVLGVFSLICTEQVCAAVPDIWRIDTRQISFIKPEKENFAKLRYYRWADNTWQASDAAAFFDSQDTAVPLSVFVPGYTSNTQQTTNVGLEIVRILNSEEQGDKKYRIVFWDWYSDKTTCRIRLDLRSKIPASQYNGGYLTLFLQSLKPDSQVCLFGFSFGSRIVCEGVQNLRSSDVAAQVRLNVVLSAAANDQNWLGGTGRYNNVVKYADKVLITYNPGDWALHYYPYLYGKGCQREALGLLGIPQRYLDLSYRDKVEQVNISKFIGSDHLTLAHFGSPAFRQRIKTYFFFETSASDERNSRSY